VLFVGGGVFWGWCVGGVFGGGGGSSKGGALRLLLASISCLMIGVLAAVPLLGNVLAEEYRRCVTQ